MAKQTIRVALPNPLLRATERIARAERWSRDEVIETALDEYRRRRDLAGQWQRLQQTVERQYLKTGKRPPGMAEIDREVHAYRAERHRKDTRGSRH